MKQENFINELNAELDRAALPMGEKLAQEEIATQPKTLQTTGAGTRSTKKFPTKIVMTSIASALAACVATICIVDAFHAGEAPTPPNVPTPPTIKRTGACMYVDINPSVAVLLDETGNVTDVLSMGADGDALLADEAFLDDLLGEKATDAAVKIAERAARCGYMDLLADGSDGEYNTVSVSFESGKALNEATLTGVADAVTSFFMEKGVYVYVQAQQTVNEAFAETEKQLKERASIWFDYAKGEAAAEAVRMLAYDVAADVLQGAFGRFNGYAALYEKNEQILQATQTLLNWEGVSYWQLTEKERKIDGVAALEAEMAELIERFYYTHGEDYRRITSALPDPITGGRFEAAYVLSQSVAEQAERLEKYLQADVATEGISMEDLLDFAAFAIVHGYSAELIEAVQISLSALFDWVEEEVEVQLQSASVWLKDWGRELFDKHSTLFDGARQAISAADYQAFLEKIEKN